MFAARNMIFAGVSLDLDPDAAAYIAAVETAKGSAVTATQSTAINDFYVAEKLASRYTSLKRMYLPIWANAAANAIDMITLGSGSFVGGVTHSSGYVQSNGSTGYFNIGTTFASMGMSSATCLIGCLVKDTDTLSSTAAMMGALTGGVSTLIRQSTPTNIQGRNTGGSGAVNGGNNLTGILTYSSTSDSSRSLRKRVAAGASSLGTSAGEAAFTIVGGNPFLMARNAGGISEPTNATIGAAFFSLGLDNTATDSLTLNLKTLWETTSGLTLP